MYYDPKGLQGRPAGEITRVVDKASQRKLDPKSKAREAAAKVIGKHGPQAVGARPRGF